MLPDWTAPVLWHMSYPSRNYSLVWREKSETPVKQVSTVGLLVSKTSCLEDAGVNANRVFLTLHIPEHNPLSCLSSAFRQSHPLLFLPVCSVLFLSLVVSRLVCSVEITNARISCFPELWGELSLQMFIRGDNLCWPVVPALLCEGWLCSVRLAEGES